jgi:hypothetical protein
MTSVDVVGIVGKYSRIIIEKLDNIFNKLDIIENRLLEIENKLKK